MVEIRVDAKIEVHSHQHGQGGGHAEILKKLGEIGKDVKTLLGDPTSLSPEEKMLLQRLVNNLNALGELPEYRVGDDGVVTRCRD